VGTECDDQIDDGHRPQVMNAGDRVVRISQAEPVIVPARIGGQERPRRVSVRSFDERGEARR